MKENPLLKLRTFGQSIWMDYIQRSLIESGKLARFIEKDGLRGVTSNPSIFDEAIASSNDYEDAIRTLARQGRSVEEIYETITTEDVRRAADVFRPTYDHLQGGDGFVSLEVNPHLAHDTAGTIAEARHLWGRLDRPNVFIKVPATIEGLPAIRQLISEGVNVNVTLLFGLPRYRAVTEAYLAGLEERAADGKPLAGVASVASFFLSRIDALVDDRLEKIMDGGGPQRGKAEAIRGEVAVASARVAYLIFRQVFTGERFRALAARGAAPQRVLWASTSTKNPEYSDVKYVEALIGPQTVNTLPLTTMDAYRDHGNPAPRLAQDLDKANCVLDSLAELGLQIDEITQQLEKEGVEKFIKPYDSLLSTLKDQRAAALGP